MATISPNLPQPIDYSIDVKMPFEASLEGFKLGSDVATIQAAQQKRLLDQQAAQQAQARQAELGTRLKSFYDKKPEERNFEEIEQLFAFAGNKEQLDALKLMAEGTDKRRLDADKRFYAQVMLGLESEPTAAYKLLDDKILAEKDPGQKAALETIKRTAETVNPAAAVNLIEPYTASIFGKDWYAGLKEARGERRLREQEKPTLEKLEAEALSAGVTAEFARPLAQAQLDKANKEKLAPSVQEALDFANLTPEQQKTFSSLQVLKKPAGAVTNVNVTNLEKTAEGELGKLVPDLYNQANSAATQLTDLPRYRKALGIAITGPLANVRLDANRIGEALGFAGDKRINATRELIQGLSEMALKSRSMLTGQGAITDREQALLLQARSGDISFSKGELDIIFNVAERAATAQYEKSKKLLSSAAAKSPTAQLFLDNVEARPGTGALNPSEQSELDALRARFPGGKR
jgi:hypothetical protein